MQSLTTDPGLHQMLPHFTSFIAEGVGLLTILLCPSLIEDEEKDIMFFSKMLDALIFFC